MDFTQNVSGAVFVEWKREGREKRGKGKVERAGRGRKRERVRQTRGRVEREQDRSWQLTYKYHDREGEKNKTAGNREEEHGGWYADGRYA